MTERKKTETEQIMCALMPPEAWPPGFPFASPFGVIQKDEHTGSFIILKALVVMPVSVPNQIVKYCGVDDIKQTGTRVVR